MGWTFGPRNKGTSHLDYFRQEMGEGVLAASGNFSEVYIAYRIRSGHVIAVVCMTEWRREDPMFNFGYKDMSEEMGINACRCPKRILDLLSPLEELASSGIFSGTSLRHAREWRSCCEERIRKLSSIRLKTGEIIRTRNSIRFFGGMESDTFVVVDPKRLVFDALVVSRDGRRTYQEPVRISRKGRIVLAEHEVVGNAILHGMTNIHPR